MTDALRTAIMRIMSEMLDDPDEHGIFDTKRFLDRIEALMEAMMVAPESMQLSGAEAVYGFTAWLTTADRFEQTRHNPQYGPTQNAAPWADMAYEFCDTNGLTDPREQWAELLTHPVDKKAA